MAGENQSTSRRRQLVSIYLHLGAAVVALVAFETALFRTGAAAEIEGAVRSVPWFLVLSAWILVAWLATRAAWRLRSPAAQYGALAAYVAGKGLILVPLLVRAESTAPGAITAAAQLTLVAFLLLTLAVWLTGADFDYLRALLWWGGSVALLVIFTALAFGLRLGPWFSLAMIALAGGGILYDTSKLARRPLRGRHPALALGLFASVGMMFWYVLRLMSRGGWSRG